MENIFNITDYFCDMTPKLSIRTYLSPPWIFNKLTRIKCDEYINQIFKIIYG